MVLNFIDPKFSDETEFETNKVMLIEFAKNCELTADEFMNALMLASKGKLVIEDHEKETFVAVKLFREINALKLGEIESAYIFWRNQDKAFETSENTVKKFLTPPPKELTPEEKLEQAKKTFKVEYARLLTGELYNCYLFFDLIVKKEEIDSLKIKFLEELFTNWKPVKMSKVSNDPIKGWIEENKTNPIVTIKEAVVIAYTNKYKLLDKSVEEWVLYWTEIYKKVYNV